LRYGLNLEIGFTSDYFGMKKWLYSVPTGPQSPALVDLILDNDLVIVTNIDPTNVLEDGG
jgi:hypothetical protein